MASTPRPQIVSYFESSEQTITSAGQLVLAHGLSAVPSLVQIYLKCVETDGNYSVDDLLLVGNHHSADGASSSGKGVSVVPDSTNITIRFGLHPTVFDLLNKTTGGVFGATNTKWRLIVRAWS